VFAFSFNHFFQQIQNKKRIQIKNLHSNIEYRFPEDKIWKKYDINRYTYTEPQQTRMLIRIQMPAFEKGDNCLFIDTIDIAGRFFFEGRQIYQHGNWTEDNHVKGFPNFYTHLILLPPEVSGKMIDAEIYADWKSIGLYNEVSLGNFNDLNERVLFAQIPNFAFSFFYAIAGISAILMYFASKDRMLIFFGLSSVSLSIVCLAESDINLTDYIWEEFSAIAGLHGYFGLVFFFTKFIAEIFDKTAKRLIHYYSIIVFFAYLYAMYFLYNFGFTRMYCNYVEIPVGLISGIGAILVVSLAIVRSYHGDTNAKILVLGLFVFFTTFSFYISFQLRLTNKNPADVHIRFFPVMLALIWMIALRYRSNLLKLQQYTLLLEESKDRLEERVKEKTFDLEVANYQLTKANRSKSEFFANVSHEFKTPLTLILSPLEKLAKSIQNSDSLFLVSIIHRNAVRIQSLVDELLTIAKIDFGVFPDEKVDIELNSYFRRMAEEFRIICEDKNLEFRLSEPQNHLFFKIDKHHWDLILRNLISNAIKFTEQGYVELTYHIQDEKILIEVLDTGIGIANEEIHLVFERFYQSERNKKVSVIGTGIGLYLVNEMVMDCHGLISVTSEIDKGTKFSLSLPIFRADPIQYIENNSETKKEIPHNIIGNSGNQKNVNILIVEDEPSMADYLNFLLKGKYNITCVSHALDAKKHIELYNYDLILSDWTLPGETGLSLLEFLKRKDKNVPFLFLTARSEQNIIESAFNLGADDFIKKPFQAEDLISRIQQKISKSKEHLQDLIVEKDTIYGDIHDIIGGKLTDLLLQINQLGKLPHITGDQLSTLKNTTNLLSLELRTKLHDWEDFRNIQNDFELGWMSMLVRRYSNSGRTCRIKLDENISWKEAESWDQKFKVEIFRISQEIANNDLKYGFGSAHWKIFSFFPEFIFEVKTKSNHSESNLRGRGSRNIEERCKNIFATFNQIHSNDDFIIKFSAPSKT